MWQYVVVEYRKVKDLEQRFRGGIHPGQPLPPEYEKPTRELELLIWLMTRRTARGMSRDVTSSNTMSDFFTLKPCSKSRLGLTLGTKRSYERIMKIL